MAAWAGAAALARYRGFDVVSDDDDARVLIAQRFAAHAALDPSGTSWLPLPFWMMGGAMKVLGATLAAARGVAVLQAGVAGALMFVAARGIGLARQSAVLACVLPLVVPLVPVLGAAPVPELEAAALALAGAVATTGERPWTGGLLLLAATLCRYETWGVAALAAGLSGLRAWTAEDASERRSALVGLALAIAGPVAWSAWSAHAHGDAFWYAKRVAAYQAGVGAALPAWAYAKALVRFAPVHVIGFAVGLALLGKKGLGRTMPLWAATLALLVGLFVSAARGGAPTHHAERALALAWMAASIGLVATLPEVLARGSRLRGLAFVVGTLGLAVAARGLVRDDMEALPRRDEERALGRSLATRIPAGEKVLLVPASFAHLATITTFGRPDDAIVVMRRSVDPRAAADDDPTESAEKLRAACKAKGARWALLGSTTALSHVGDHPEAFLVPGAVLVRVE